MALQDYYSLGLWIPAGILLYIGFGIIYRLYFHPLSKFPGPKLAAITHLYEFYYNLVQNGMFMWEVEKMHEKYGTSIVILVLLHKPRGGGGLLSYFYFLLTGIGNPIQDRLFASHLTSFMSRILLSTTKFTPHLRENAKSILGLLRILEPPRLWSRPLTMNITASVALP